MRAPLMLCPISRGLSRFWWKHPDFFSFHRNFSCNSPDTASPFLSVSPQHKEMFYLEPQVPTATWTPEDFLIRQHTITIFSQEADRAIEIKKQNTCPTKFKTSYQHIELYSSHMQMPRVRGIETEEENMGRNS